MNITVVGTGYVGLVTGACFADMGVDVTCVDIDSNKVERLRKGQIPIYEPGLDELVVRNSRAGRLHFTTSLGDSLNSSDVIFIAVGTPPGQDGSADLSYVLGVAEQIGSLIEGYRIVAVKSTVPVGTCLRVKSAIEAKLNERGRHEEFDVASNPEFLKEGVAVKDFMSPDRVVVGVENFRARVVMERLYKPFMLVNDRMIVTDLLSSEMIKYAANSMLATRISFMNDIANLCELVGADATAVRKGIGADTRIGNKFLYPGCGYGGSCFPKDVKALIATGRQHDYRMAVLEAVVDVNERQKELLFDKVGRLLGGELSGRRVTVWGLSFKPETDDIREASALVLIDRLLSAGVEVRVCDPVAVDNVRAVYGDRLVYCDDRYEALRGSDCLVLVTEWKEYRMPSWSRVGELMRSKNVVDGRNIFDRNELESIGFAYSSIGYHKQ